MPMSSPSGVVMIAVVRSRAKAPDEFVGRRVGAYRRGTVLHRLLGRGVGRYVQRAGAEASEQNSGLGGDEREAVGGIRDPRRDVTDRVGQPTCNDVGPGELAGGDELGSPFDGEVVGEPVGFSGDVVVDVLEAERVEPARGSWAHVSEVVVAVDDDRPVGVERGGRAPVELLERDVDRPGEMRLFVFVRWQHFDELSVVVDEALEVCKLDPGAHASFSL
jgi:hypothetical protein